MSESLRKLKKIYESRLELSTTTKQNRSSFVFSTFLWRDRFIHIVYRTAVTYYHDHIGCYVQFPTDGPSYLTADSVKGSIFFYRNFECLTTLESVELLRMFPTVCIGNWIVKEIKKISDIILSPTVLTKDLQNFNHTLLYKKKQFF